MAYLLAFKMDGAWFVNKIIKFIGSLLNTSKPNIKASLVPTKY